MKSTQARCSEKNGYSNDRFHSRIVVARLGGGGVTTHNTWSEVIRNRRNIGSFWRGIDKNFSLKLEGERGVR